MNLQDICDRPIPSGFLLKRFLYQENGYILLSVVWSKTSQLRYSLCCQYIPTVLQSGDSPLTAQCPTWRCLLH